MCKLFEQPLCSRTYMNGKKAHETLLIIREIQNSSEIPHSAPWMAVTKKSDTIKYCPEYRVTGLLVHD